jgi:hypothetical protein
MTLPLRRSARSRFCGEVKRTAPAQSSPTGVESREKGEEADTW